MADRRRIITFSNDTKFWPFYYGGRPVLELDLEVGGSFQAIAETFAYQPGNNNQIASREPGRFGGQQSVSEQNDNGTVAWQALVQGATPDVVAGNIEALLTAANRTIRGRLIEWRPDGATYSSYFRIAGPGTWKPTYKWAQWQGAHSMIVDVNFPVRPLVVWDPMTIGDPFDIDSSADYTVDAAGGTTTVGSNQVTASSSLSAERRWRHTARGYQLLEGQALLNAKVGTTLSGYKAGALLRASTASTYIEAYVDDNGTNSRLNIDVVIGGTRTNRATTNLTRLTTGTTFFVRARVEGQTVTAEYFNQVAGDPLNGIAATATISYTLTAGEQTSLVAGFTGWSWVPQQSSAALMRFAAYPFAWRGLTLPKLVQPLDAIPGSAPALVDVTVETSSSDTDTPAWPLIAWCRVDDDGTSGSDPSFGIFEAESFSAPVGWASTVDAASRGGNALRVTTSGAGTFTANLVFSGYVEADEFADGEYDAEIWARVIVSSTLVTPRLKVSLNGAVPVDTLEYGSAGKLLTLPASSTVYRTVRLGTLPIGTGSASFKFTGTVAAGSSGVFGIDYVEVVPARRRVAGVTGVPLAQTVSFVPQIAQYRKKIRSDLSSTTTSTGAPSSTPGPGGALIQPNPGVNWWLVKLSSLVPDDPTVNTSSEALAHTAAVTLGVIPRSYMLRSG